MTESTGIVIAAVIAALMLLVGEVICIRERRIDRTATRVGAAQKALRLLIVEAGRAPKRHKPEHLQAAIQATGSISASLEVARQTDRPVLMCWLEAVATTPDLTVEDVARLMSVASSRLDVRLMSRGLRRSQEASRQWGRTHRFAVSRIVIDVGDDGLNR